MTAILGPAGRRAALAAAALTLAIFGNASDSLAQGGVYDVRLGTSSASSSHAVFYAKFGEIVNKNVKDTRWTVVNTGGIEDNHALIARKQVEVIASSSYASYDHYNGIGEYKGRANKALRSLFFRTPAPQNLIVRADAGINSIQDLAGKAFMAGSRGTTTETLTIRLFDALGVKPNYFRGSLEDGVSAFQDGRIVGINKASPGLAPDATYSRLSLQIKIKGLGFSDADVARIKKAAPEIGFMRIPANTALPGSPEVRSLVIPLVIVTTTEMPERIGYEVVKTMHKNFPEIAKIYAGVRGVDVPKGTLEYATIPLHVGVVRYFKELGLTVPKELIPAEYKG